MGEPKLRILIIERMLSKDGITVKQIIEKLEKNYNITAKRRTIYDDLNVLSFFYPIVQQRKGSTTVYILESED